MRELTVLYDEACPLCVRCRAWLAEQPAYIKLSFMPSGSAEARAKYGAVPWLGAELCVVSDEGDVWVGPVAFLMCLWALRDYRMWSYRLSGPSFSHLAERFFHALSSQRRRIAAWLEPARCPDGSCKAHHAGAPPYRYH
jgi:predicted DCC family thiol-disulfide oxidoreductase YuxK